MSKSMVEKYEQALVQDPASTMFVELAKAYLDKGDTARAVEVCQQGLTHHPNSVVGRVLWGKALIHAGKAADAMKQFDLAVNIDKDNPHAYNLIGEALLKKGLFRSALPILRKAAVLQPNDGRIAQWLEQTKAALAGGPSPVLYDMTAVDTKALVSSDAGDTGSTAPILKQVESKPVARVELPIENQPTDLRRKIESKPERVKLTPAPSARAEHTLDESEPTGQHAVPVAARVAAKAHAPVIPSLDDVPTRINQKPKIVPPKAIPTPVAPIETTERNQISMKAQVDNRNVPTEFEVRTEIGIATTELPLIDVDAVEDGRVTTEIPLQSVPVALRPFESPAEKPASNVISKPTFDPFDEMSQQMPEDPEVFHGLTGTFDTLAADAQAELPQVTAPLVSAPPQLFESPSTPVVPLRTPPSIVVSEEVISAPISAPFEAGLLDDVVSAQSDLPTSEFQLPDLMNAPLLIGRQSKVDAPRSSPKSSSLLADIPDEVEPLSEPMAATRSSTGEKDAESIAREYERELRAKLEAKSQKKSFFQKYGLKIAALLGVLVVAGGALGSFVYTRNKNQGLTLDSAIAKGITGIAADTKEQYQSAIKSLDQALAMDQSNVEALALKGYSHAVLFAEHGKNAADKQAAAKIFESPKVGEARPEMALLGQYFLEENQTTARQQLLSSEIEKSVVRAQAGRVLLDDKKYEEALAQLKKATELDPRNTRALVALGDYYLAFEDFENAYEILGRAESLSKFHPKRVMGMAEARLALQKEPAEALSELQSLPQNAQIPDAYKTRYALLLTRALSANGQHEEALKNVAGLKPQSKAEEFQLAFSLGLTHQAAGQMERAQKKYEEAIALDDKSQTAKERLGRVMLARSREKELLERLKSDKGDRVVSLLRGIAYSRSGDMKKARTELQNTQVNGKFPAEAAVYLALADAQDQPDKAIEVLEKINASTKKNKATVQVALARVYMQKGALDKAKIQLEEAAKDPADYEGNALLGELLLNAGLPAEVALEPLTKAVERNGSHAPSRNQLGKILVSSGKFAEAAKNADTWLLDNPTLELAQRQASVAYWQAGRVKDAAAVLAKLKIETEDLEALRTRAQILFANGDGAGAMASLVKANQTDSKDAQTFCEIGFAFIRQGNNDFSLKAFEQALANNPKSVCATYGTLFAKPISKGKPSPIDVLNKLQSQAATSWERGQILATIARLQLDAKDVAAARSTVNDALVAAPFSALANLVAFEVSKKEKSDDVIESISKAAQYDASWIGIHMNLAELLAKKGGAELPKAAKEYELVLATTPPENQNEAEIAKAKKALAAVKAQIK
jgi:cellulose synthase operon protein C